ncbi:RNA-guided endonuclease TnpB family protein [Hydrogenivirga sp. 128-5-R1-1]|uniref:RNA-guided endonuclease TnpB family protein n=1 Tax=Hydrogenivirga sp. 128-5-R1-1 TaxID=392423 RepID=UPI00015EF079|nr:RNA-guided endonuclease TnpB family protein [Hydrogenivirga sp. 128-5-R1-1]EDP74665.1 IS1341-type transposase [Hydrogenivirga sp. 128-5-R1-1]
MNKVLKLTAKREKVKFKLLLLETGREEEVKFYELREALERFVRGVRVAYLKTLPDSLEGLEEKGRPNTRAVNSNELSKRFPPECAKVKLGSLELELGKDNIASSIRYTIEKDIRENLKREFKTIAIKSVPIIARVHTTKSHPYEKAFGEVFRIFEISEPDEKNRVSVRVGVKFFKQVEVEGKKATPVLVVEAVMRLKGRDYATANSYYNILKRIKEGEYKVAYAGLSYREGSGISLLLSYNLPDISEDDKRENILGIDLGQACPVYWSLITPELEKKKLTNGRHPRGQIEYPVNLEGAIRKLWRAKRNLLSSLRRIEEQTSLLSEGNRDLKGRLLRRKREVERSLKGMRRKEKNLMKKMDEFLANEVIRVALRERCRKIRMERLDGVDKTELYFPKWNYGQLQNLIEQRASLYGIEVERVNPRKTSQRCPSCGYVGQRREEVRPTRDLFRCPECGEESFADFVGAFNVGIGGWEAFKPKEALSSSS